MPEENTFLHESGNPFNAPEKSKQELLGEILYLSIESQYSTERCVFVEFSGHIDKLTISIRESPTNYSVKVAEREISLKPSPYMTTDEDIAIFEDILHESLISVKKSLRKFLEDGEITNDNLTAITTYTF